MGKVQRMSAKDFQEYIKGTQKTPSKYGAKRTDGYASKKEANRASQLRLLQCLGSIRDLKEQVPFLLIPPQHDECGNLLERGVSYVADFVYKDRKGNIVVEDTKGVRTREYILKRKLMLKEHGIRITEI